MTYVGTRTTVAGKRRVAIRIDCRAFLPLNSNLEKPYAVSVADTTVNTTFSTTYIYVFLKNVPNDVSPAPFHPFIYPSIVGSLGMNDGSENISVDVLNDEPISQKNG